MNSSAATTLPTVCGEGCACAPHKPFIVYMNTWLYPCRHLDVMALRPRVPLRRFWRVYITRASYALVYKPSLIHGTVYRTFHGRAPSLQHTRAKWREHHTSGFCVIMYIACSSSLQHSHTRARSIEIHGVSSLHNAPARRQWARCCWFPAAWGRWWYWRSDPWRWWLNPPRSQRSSWWRRPSLMPGSLQQSGRNTHVLVYMDTERVGYRTRHEGNTWTYSARVTHTS